MQLLTKTTTTLLLFHHQMDHFKRVLVLGGTEFMGRGKIHLFSAEQNSCNRTLVKLFEYRSYHAEQRQLVLECKFLL